MNLLQCLLSTLILVQCLIKPTGTNAVVGDRSGNRGSRIIGGSTAQLHSHPYVISLQAQLLWARFHFCGGSLISESWVITAAHCVTESWLIALLNIFAIAGAHHVDVEDEFVQSQKIIERIPNPKYKGGVGPNDIAVLKTFLPFIITFAVQPIKLPSQALNLEDGTLILAGWGALRSTYFFPDMPNYLQELNVTYVPYAECQTKLDYHTYFFEDAPVDEDSNICTGPLAGGTAACAGDSGGPLVLRFINFDEASPLQDTDYTETTADILNEITELSISTDNHFGNESNGVSENTYPTEYYDITEFNDTDNVSSNDVNGPIDAIESNLKTTTIKPNEHLMYNSAPTLSKEEYLVGVVSWGVYPCGEVGAPTVYTNVSNFLKFIGNHVKLEQ